MAYQYDVIVVGGGHAGVEAATAAARYGARTLLCTFSFEDFGALSCNPAVGGLGKGHLVQEIDALDGVLGRVADMSGIHFRLLNRSKGVAVQGARIQVDRGIFKKNMKNLLSTYPSLTLCEGEVSRLLFAPVAQEVTGIEMATGETFSSKAVVLTFGTFGRGQVYVGKEFWSAGRWQAPSSNALLESLDTLGLRMGRLKTGTPPRLKKESIDFNVLEEQPSDSQPTFLSFLTQRLENPTLSCYITYTNPQSHDFIRASLSESPGVQGVIKGVAPRYCPSIEDKVRRFASRDRHQIFLEPEGLDSPLIYPNGLSMSLPRAIQQDFLRTIKGLENVEIETPAYAIEYDFFDPRQLLPTLMVRSMKGLFFAGQINGTTGYEEAAAQGLLAGLNAAMWSSSGGADRTASFFELKRDEAYLGVLIDDLITKGTEEPYRMFTSRAEYRLRLRRDNADLRLTPLGIKIGCVGHHRQAIFEEKKRIFEELKERLHQEKITSQHQKTYSWAQGQVGKTLWETLSIRKVTVNDIESFWNLSPAQTDVLTLLDVESHYAPYLRRQESQISTYRLDSSLLIPQDFPYDSISGLSREVVEKLQAACPRNIAQAGRISGVTPAALVLLVTMVRKYRKESLKKVDVSEG